MHTNHTSTILRKVVLLPALVGILFLGACRTKSQNASNNSQSSTEEAGSNSSSNSNAPTAPDLSGTGPDGKTYKLSDYRGKIVLLDFWASWCGPCRKVNPQVVALYEKYHGKRFKGASDFDIFSVSLDQRPDNWKAAIEKDRLKWPAHISDFKGWYSAYAATYAVEAIPTSFLLDADGKIIGNNLEPHELDVMLGGMLK